MNNTVLSVTARGSEEALDRFKVAAVRLSPDRRACAFCVGYSDPGGPPYPVTLDFWNGPPESDVRAVLREVLRDAGDPPVRLSIARPGDVSEATFSLSD